MKLQLAALVFGATLVSANVLAAEEAESSPSIIKVLASSIPHAALFGISFDHGQGVAVGAGGSILTSEDAGATWHLVPNTPTQQALLAVSSSGDHKVAVGQMGVVAYEATPGSWKLGNTGGEDRLLAVGVNSKGLAVAAGQFGVVLRSTDGGRTWAKSPPDWESMADPTHFGTGEPTVYSVKVEESGRVTIAGEFGMIMRSDDGGVNWYPLHPINGDSPSINALYVPRSGTGMTYAVGQRGYFLQSSDDGQTWEQKKLPTEHNLLGVAAASNGQVVITGMRTMVRSTDNGQTWQSVEEGDTTTSWYQAIDAESSKGNLIAVGHGGRIIKIGG